LSNTAHSEIDQSFLPIYNENARVLILGSLPGKRSIAEQGYYAHPQNAFWPIMAQILGFDTQLEYAMRLEQLKVAGVALWDVVAQAERPGSLDSAIVRSGAQYNDIPDLLGQCSQIELIAFNGAAAAEMFQRAKKCWGRELKLPKSVKLPSTSPAHAAMSREQKLAAWQGALSEIVRA